MIDAEVAERQGLPLVLAADQHPFRYTSSSGFVNRFCVLQPLMTLEGDRLDVSPRGFPNRARVWWMLRDEIPEEIVVPGSLWVARIEPAKWEPKDPESDKYQAKVKDIQPGGVELIEILNVPGTEPDLAYFQRGKRLDWARPTTPQVFLRGARTVLGPLKAKWFAEQRQIEFSAVSAGNPEILLTPLDRFNALVREEQFTIALNEFDPQSEKMTAVVRLTRSAWVPLEKLRAAATTLDASTDAQVINWAMKQYKVTHAEANPVKKFFARIAEDTSVLDDQQASSKLRRLRELEADADRVVKLGETVAQSVAGTPAFEELVRRHLDAVVQQEIARLVALKQDEIRRAVQTEQHQLEAVQGAIRRLSADYEKRAAAQDEEFKARWDERLRQLEQRERNVQDRERAVAEQEESLHLRLERVIQRYQKEGERIGDDLVAQFPILRRLGLGAGGSVETVAAEGEPVELRLPYWLKEERSGEVLPAIDEPTFIAQLQRVVERRGFTFQTEDLLNFHVCVKIGGLTVLAGPSGTGKSSLPRLYAEALGWKNRYLQVPVRPDWLDDRDFLGAYNALARRFEPASSGVADHLIAAMLAEQRNLDDLYLVTLDEMNLARVEHYFAQFLSVLEAPLEERNIALFAPGLARPSDPYAPYQSIHLGENVRFLGTVNIDETTHFFSPKVLDRCQVVSFAPPNLEAVRQRDQSDVVAGVIPVGLTSFLGWSQPPDSEGTAREFVLRVADLLRKSRLVLGIRQFDRMLRYAASARPFLEEDKALDFQMMQVVLPRLRRTAAGFDDTVRGLRELIVRARYPRSAELLERIAEAGLENEYFQLL